MGVGIVKRKSIGYILRTKVSFEVEKFMKMVEPYVLPDFMYKVKHPYVNSKTGIVPVWNNDITRNKCRITGCHRTALKDRSKCYYHSRLVLAVA